MIIDTTQAEIEVMQGAGQILAEKLVDEWMKQGHHLTGAWENSLKYTIIATGQYTTATGTMNGYGVFVNTGIMPDRIPFGGASTGAKTSKYIEGLKAFWMLRGLGEKEALRAAFATAKKQKNEGMPTSGSYRFSESGQRTLFIEIVNNGGMQEVHEFVLNGIDGIVKNIINQTKSQTI